MTSVTNRMDNTEIPVASAALVLAIWIALAVAVIVVLNLAKWTVRNSKRLNRATAGTALGWPAADARGRTARTCAAGSHRRVVLLQSLSVVQSIATPVSSAWSGRFEVDSRNLGG